ncbi:MAG TPA: hypothetical protein VFU90_06920, partial [Candidatus Tumulicola sp.]|nr:hypothetical protein [Candidatus Tumulicola sp.]
MHRLLRDGTRVLTLLALCACGGTESPTLSTPVKIVAISGGGQAADLGQPLAQPLVARVTTSTGTPASAVSVTFAVTSGAGTLSPATVSTDGSGNASTTFTMGQTPGVTTVSATSGAVAGAAADFIVSTGPTIVVHVALAAGNVRLPALSHGPLRAPVVMPGIVPRPIKGLQLDVAYRPSAIGVPGPGAIRSLGLDQARVIAASIRSRLTTMPIASRFEVMAVSPAIAVARLRVHAASDRDSVMRALRADPAVASVSVDGLVSRGPIAKSAFTPVSHGRPRASANPGAGTIMFPATQGMDAQLWNYTLIDAPRAWHVVTGSPSVVVAVIDDGINQHPDIAANLDMS